MTKMWIKVDEPGYNGAHYRVRVHRGDACNYECVDKCGKTAQQWSQIRGTTGFDPEHYEPRCKSCHNKYDWRTGNYAKITPEKASEIKDLYATGSYYQRELGDMFGLTQSTISSIVNNKIWVGNAYKL